MENLSDNILHEFVSQGILGVLVLFGIVSVYKLLRYIDKKDVIHTERVEKIIKKHEELREKSEDKFITAIEKVELNVKFMVDEFRNYIKK